MTATTESSDVTSQSLIWSFQGHDVYAQVFQPTSGRNKQDFFGSMFAPMGAASQKPCSVLLIHGFGCSSVYWRETAKALVEAGYTVHAIDLLGQGQSAKPGRAQGIEYSTHLWAQQIDGYAQENVNPRHSIVVMGNSLGSVVALSVATGDFLVESNGKVAKQPYVATRIKGIGMYNCGVGMNSRNLLKDPSLNPLSKAIFTALFDLLDALIFNNVPLLTYVLDKVVTKELLQNALTGLYKCAKDPASRVDETLVDSFYVPAKQPGSVEALNQIYTNDAGPSPMEYHDRYAQLGTAIPMHVIWGTEDNVTPLAGPVGQLYTKLAADETILPYSYYILEFHRTGYGQLE